MGKKKGRKETGKHSTLSLEKKIDKLTSGNQWDWSFTKLNITNDYLIHHTAHTDFDPQFSSTSRSAWSIYNLETMEKLCPKGKILKYEHHLYRGGASESGIIGVGFSKHDPYELIIYPSNKLGGVNKDSISVFHLPEPKWEKSRESVTNLLKTLEGDDPIIKMKAIRTLFENEGGKALEPLGRMVEDPDPGVRWYAVRSLVKIGDARTITPLGKASKDENLYVRIAAVKGLGKLEDKKVIPALVSALEDEDWLVRKDSAAFLENLGWKPKTREERINNLISKERWKKLELLKGKDVEYLIQILQNKEKYIQIKYKIAQILGKKGEKGAVEPLIKLVQDKNKKLRKCAIEALEKIGDERAVDVLVLALKDRELKVPKQAARALGSIGRPSIKPLIQILGNKESEWEARRQAAIVLGEIKAHEALKTLLKIHREKSFYLKNEVAKALGKLGDKAAVKPLIKTFKTKDRWGSIQCYSADALGEIGDSAAVEPLLNGLLTDANVNVKFHAARAIGKIRDGKAVEPLIKALKNENDFVRQASAEALGILEDPRAVQGLVDALKDEYPPVRKEAGKALGRLGWKPRQTTEKTLFFIALKDYDQLGSMELERLDKYAIQSFIHLLNDEDERGRKIARKILEENSSAVNKYLLGSLKSKNRDIRLSSIRLLGSLGNNEALLPLLQTYCRGHFDDRDYIVAALVRIKKGRSVSSNLKEKVGYQDHPQLIGWALAELKDTRVAEMFLHGIINNMVRVQAVEEIGKIGDDKARKLLIKLLKDWDIGARRNAATALGIIEDPEAIGPLSKCLEDKDRILRLNTVKALGKIGDARAVKPLARAMKDKSPDVRSEALNALGSIGGEGALEPLSWALNDRLVKIREQAVLSIGNIPDKRSVNYLIQALGDKNPKVRQAAAKALGDQGDARALEALGEAIKDKNKGVREAAQKAFIKIKRKSQGSG